MSSTEQPNKVRQTTLADFAGTYENHPDFSQNHHFTSLTDAIWPKHPPVTSSDHDYRNIDRVKVVVEGKKVTLTFLVWGKVFNQVTYEEGRDFSLYDSAVGLKSGAGAAATLGKGGDEMAGMIPVLPAAGAAVQWGQLFLNEKGDIVVRTDTTLGALVFFVVPFVYYEGTDTIFRRVNPADDLKSGYGQPRSDNKPVKRPPSLELRRERSDFATPDALREKFEQRLEDNADCVTHVIVGSPWEQWSLVRSGGTLRFDFQFAAVHQVGPPPSEKSPETGSAAAPEIPPYVHRYISPRTVKMRLWLTAKGIPYTEDIPQNMLIWPNRNPVDYLFVSIDCGTDLNLVRTIFAYAAGDLYESPLSGHIETIYLNPAQPH